MTIFALAQNHNFTITLDNITPQNWKKHRGSYAYEGPELIVGTVRFTTLPSFSILTQQQFDKFDRFLLMQIYGNGFTSIITVAAPMRGLQSVQELIKDNYSIVYNPRRRTLSAAQMYGRDMQDLGLSVETAFTTVELEDFDILQEIADNDKKFAMISDTSISKYFKASSMNHLNVVSNSSFICFTIHETIHQELYYWILKIETTNTCLGQLVPKIITESDQYVLYFFKTTGILQDKLEPDISLRSRFVHFNNASSLRREAYRFSKTFNVFIFALHERKDMVQLQIHSLKLSHVLVPSRTMMLLFWTDPRWQLPTVVENIWQRHYKVIPVLKIILYLSSGKCDRNAVSISVLCSGGCSKNDITWSADEFQQKFHLQRNLYGVHRSLFWNGYRKSIAALTTDPYRCFQDSNESLRQNLVKPEHCGANIMSIFIMANHHNFTISVDKITPQNWKKHRASYAYQGPELIVGTVRFITVPSFSMLTQQQFGKFDSKSVHYCHCTGKPTEVWYSAGVWGEPFTSETWLGVFTIVIFSTLISLFNRCYIYQTLSKFLHFVSIILGHNDCKRFRFFLVPLSIGFLVSQLYGNGLTSTVTVATPIIRLKNVDELIRNNFSIVFNPLDHGLSAEKIYGRDLESIGYSVKSAFTLRELGQFGVLDEIGDKDKKLAMISDTSVSKYFKAVSIHYLNTRSNSSFICFTLDQTIHLELYYWIFKIESQYWLKSTLQRIIASSLYSKWNEWSNWNAMLKEKLFAQTFPVTSDVVNLSKLLCIFLCFVLLLGASVLVFCIECKPFV
ncbi:unnamed protein product [Orchesella dallaii]|uniref:Uncharacterized protein n=1 Tax=Orchesella dallaii TaxID=48710 RepID=A0ABP1RQL7_9HEXA